MLKKILYAARICGLSYGIVFVQLVSATMLPYPLYAMNVSIAGLILAIVVARRGTIVWLGFLVGILFDLYSASFFGLYSICFTFTSLCMYWLYREIFTAQSVWAIAVLAATATIVFRVVYVCIILLTSQILWHDILWYSSSELFLTILLTMILYFALGIYKRTLPMGT